jgi:hypothetical protein
MDAYHNYSSLDGISLPDNLRFEIASLKAVLSSLYEIKSQQFLEVVKGKTNLLDLFEKYNQEKSAKLPFNVKQRKINHWLNKSLHPMTAPARTHLASIKMKELDEDLADFIGRCDSNWTMVYEKLATQFMQAWEFISNCILEDGYFYTPMGPVLSESNYTGDEKWSISFTIIAPYMHLSELQSVHMKVVEGAMSRHLWAEIGEMANNLCSCPHKWAIVTMGHYPFLRPFRINTKQMSRLLRRVIRVKTYQKAYSPILCSMVNEVDRLWTTLKLLFPVKWNSPIK